MIFQHRIDGARVPGISVFVVDLQSTGLKSCALGRKLRVYLRKAIG